MRTAAIPVLLGLLAGCAPSAPAGPSETTASPEAPVEVAAVAPPSGEADSDDTDPAPRTFFVAERDVKVLSGPASDAARRGLIRAGSAFEVLERVDGPDCAAGWARLPAHGFACLDHAVPGTEAPVAQPPLVTYDPPEPAEFEHYLQTGEYDASEPVALVPAFYAKRWRRFQGRLYADLTAWNAGDPPVGHLEGGAGNKYRFVEVVQTERGPVLLRSDGKVAALDDVYLYPVSRLVGRDLQADPLPEGQWPGLTVAYEGAQVRVAPDEDAEIGAVLPYHTPVVIRSQPVGDGRWWALIDALGPGVDGYLDDRRSLRHPMPAPDRPLEVGDDELWIDVELDQQVLQLYRGDRLVYWTVVSTGAAPMGTPRGTWRVTDKMATRTMRSRPGAADAYYVEDVPWTMHWRPAYALHAASHTFLASRGDRLMQP